MLPPAAPTTQLSIARIAVGRPITRSERSDRPAALDDRDVRARAAALDDDRVRQTELVQRRRDAGRRDRSRS